MSWSIRVAFLLALAWRLTLSAAAAEPLLTRWAAEISPSNVLPEYPRPQLVRERWQNLNGLWDYALADPTESMPGSMTNRILVPFPLESRLSGVGRHLDELALWYRRPFTVPAAWRGQLVHLHFGAVDWAAKIFVNGRQLGGHRGGYDTFTLDITPALKWDATNELVVMVVDPTEGNQPRGKQSRKPEGAFYSASSGIWQTVWLEPVPPIHLSGVSLVPDLAGAAVRVIALANTAAADLRVEVVASFQGREAGRATGLPGQELKVPLRAVHPWSPANPALYDLELKLSRGAQPLDGVRSYFGLRDIRVGTDEAGRRRLVLNGQPLFQTGVLDQGYWPDGLYTAPSDEALRFDLETAKRLGFNLVRMHVKVEAERWYYWADRLGLLVWQDMPSGNNTSEPVRRQFEMELSRLIEQKANHPCIIMWVLFNEGWGQYDTERLVRRLKLADATRLVDSASGWTDFKVGDVIDLHNYPDPVAPSADPARAGVLGEFGGLHLEVNGHAWAEPTWGYSKMQDSGQLTRDYSSLQDKIGELQKNRGLAAAVYTQLTDVETEANGFLTYDREVLKVAANEIRRANLHETTPQTMAMLLLDARSATNLWSYTTNTPAPGWEQPEFDAAAWSCGPGGFGSRGTPAAIVNTEWNTADIWLRREFTLPQGFEPPSALTMSHDEDAQVYFNGVLAVQAAAFTVGYQEFQLGAAARAALRPGRNVLAIHCHQTGGGQYIDAGLLAAPAAR